jgi:hypothetical protein
LRQPLENNFVLHARRLKSFGEPLGRCHGGAEIRIGSQFGHIAGEGIHQQPLLTSGGAVLQMGFPCGADLRDYLFVESRINLPVYRHGAIASDIAPLVKAVARMTQPSIFSSVITAAAL